MPKMITLKSGKQVPASLVGKPYTAANGYSYQINEDGSVKRLGRQGGNSGSNSDKLIRRATAEDLRTLPRGKPTSPVSGGGGGGGAAAKVRTRSGGGGGRTTAAAAAATAAAPGTKTSNGRYGPPTRPSGPGGTPTAPYEPKKGVQDGSRRTGFGSTSNPLADYFRGNQTPASRQRSPAQTGNTNTKQKPGPTAEQKAASPGRRGSTFGSQNPFNVIGKSTTTANSGRLRPIPTRKLTVPKVETPAPSARQRQQGAGSGSSSPSKPSGGRSRREGHGSQPITRNNPKDRRRNQGAGSKK